MRTRPLTVVPGRLTALFLLLTAAPLAAFAWLGYRLIEQERVIDHDRFVAGLQQSASLLAADLDRLLTGWNQQLTSTIEHPSAPVVLPSDAGVILFDQTGVTRRLGAQLPYYPPLADEDDSEVSTFSKAEAQEFLPNGDRAKAEAEYHRLARSTHARVRAGALLRLARALTEDGKIAGALVAYGELASMGDTPVAMSRAELVGRAERLRLFAANGRTNDAARERDIIATALRESRFAIDRPAFDFYAAAIKPATVDVPPASSALAEAVQQLWPRWQRADSGRIAIVVDDVRFVSVWRRVGTTSAALVAPLDDVFSSTRPIARSLSVVFALTDPEPSPMTQGDDVRLASRETGLPWSLRVGPAPVRGVNYFCRLATTISVGEGSAKEWRPPPAALGCCRRPVGGRVSVCGVF